MSTAFDVTLRGYDREQVDRLILQAEVALRTESRYTRGPVLKALRLRSLQTRLRGYDRRQVELAFSALTEQLS